MMKRLILLVIFAVIGWQGYVKYQNSRINRLADQSTTDSGTQGRSGVSRSNDATTDATTSSQFKCDGRTHCAQMTSCAEATYFLKNCPGTKMDGNYDGIPCEKQWCR
ncbi:MULTISPECIES: excalibur calcium-binding domain-containing protein [Candidatus Accumulibacter]